MKMAIKSYLTRMHNACRLSDDILKYLHFDPITMLLGEVRLIEAMLSGGLPYAHLTIPQVTERKYLCIVKTSLLKLRIHTFRGKTSS